MSEVTVFNTSTSRGVKVREYRHYKELFYNLTLRELRSKYKRSVIGWGWSMINPLANMVIYTIVFSQLFKIHPPEGIPSRLNSYALMYLSGMLPWMMFQGSVMDSMGSLLSNQNLIQKTYFPRELIPASTVASRLISHLIEMSLLMVAIVAVGNYKALVFLPGVLVVMAAMTIFALGLSLLFSIGNVFFRDIQHFAGIFFFIWMYLTPVTYPFYLVGGGIETPNGLENPGRFTNLGGLLGHQVSLGTIFKINPMTDAVLTFQSLIYDSSLPSVTRKVSFPSGVKGQPPLLEIVHSQISWGGVAYFFACSVLVLVFGLWVFRKYEARLPEEL